VEEKEPADGRSPYSTKVDVYSYGVFLYQIFTGDCRLETGKLARCAQQLMMYAGRGGRYPRPEKVPDAFWRLITQCWCADPDRRPSFAEITRMMMDSDDFTFERMDMAEYREYCKRIVRDSSIATRIDPSPILTQFRSWGIEIDQMQGLVRP
jgi:serine/threonine protein kinase